jgi:hypothetical protein
MKIKLCSLFFLFLLTCFSQTQIESSQLKITINVTPPETSVFFSAVSQTIFTLTPGQNKEITKVIIYRNGVRQTDVGKITAPAKNADYTLSTDRKTITFVLPLVENDTILIDYWIK